MTIPVTDADGSAGLPICVRQREWLVNCCAGMFVAVEEAEGSVTNRITFEMFRGEDPCWMIDGIHSFISYCPWCGKKLPNRTF